MQHLDDPQVQVEFIKFLHENENEEFITYHPNKCPISKFYARKTKKKVTCDFSEISIGDKYYSIPHIAETFQRILIKSSRCTGKQALEVFYDCL